MGILQLPRDLKWLFLSNFLWMCGSGLYYYTLPVYAAQLGASPSQVGMMFSIGFLAATLFLLPSGWLAQRFERRKLLLWAWYIGGLSGPVFFLANRWEWLIVGEVLNWGSMFAITAVQAYTLQADTSGRPAYTLSLVFASIPLGLILSPWVGGYLADLWGPKAVFLTSTLVYALSTAALYPMRRQWPEAAPDAAAQRFNLGQLREALLSWTHATPQIWQLTLAVGSGEILFSLTAALGQVYVVDLTGADYKWVGILGSLTSLGAALLGPVMGAVAERSSHRGALQVSALLQMVYAAVLIAVPQLFPAVAGAFLLRGAMEGTRPLRAASVAAHVTPDQVGSALSLSNIAWGIFGTVGSYLGGWLYQLDRTLPFWLTVAGGAAYLLLLQAGLPGRGHAGPGRGHAG